MPPNPDPSEIPVLATEGLGRAVAGKRLVAEVSIAVGRGEVLAVLGPSGAGKSSLLRLINRLDEATEGAVFLEGQDVRELSPRELRRRVGMVMQAPYLFPGTVADNLRFGPRQRGEALSDADLEALLERVGLAGYGPRDPGELSGGEAQRVSLARTLANGPEAVLLDEPTSSLDEAAEREVERLVGEIVHERELACVIVTHDVAQARRMADKALWLRDGRVVGYGSAREVLDAWTLAR